MDEDITWANGITIVFKLHWINLKLLQSRRHDALTKMLEVFGVVFGRRSLDADIEALIAERQEARAKKDFARADAIRDELVIRNQTGYKEGAGGHVVDANLVNGLFLA